MWCPGEERGRGRCVTSEEVRLDRPASEMAVCGRPHASRGAALLERGGPLRGRGRCWGDRDGRYGSISVCPAVRYLPQRATRKRVLPYNACRGLSVAVAQFDRTAVTLGETVALGSY